MTRFFTWHDIEIVFEKNRSSWPMCWNDVKVYPDSVVIYYRPQKGDKEESSFYLKGLLRKNYKSNEQNIVIDFDQTNLEVIMEEEEEGSRQERPYAPLFREIYMAGSDGGVLLDKLPGSRILAFHSYKGGVGRTLSLVSLLRECTAEYPDKRILVIDADMEAPGLTWMLEDRGAAPISYLDILSLIHYKSNMKKAIPKIVDMIRTSVVMVSTDREGREQFFVPVCRNQSQMLEVSSISEHILNSKDNKYVITETLSEIGAVLGAEIILIDLHAGITEYSAPFLFDPRVEKYYVSSTSLQSVKGMNQILNEIYKKTSSNLFKSKVLMTMIPETMDKDRVEMIEDQILEGVEAPFDGENDTFLRENYIIPIEFDNALIHIGDFQDVCELLQNKKITEIMRHLVKELFPRKKSLGYFQKKEAQEILQKIHSIAEEEVTAEGSSSANILATSSIREIVRNFRNTVPRIVVSGAKGAGKTYIYKQLLAAKTWGKFEQLIEKVPDSDSENRLIVPLIASLNLKKIKGLIQECVANLSMQIGNPEIKESFVNDNLKNLRDYLEQKNNPTRGEWSQKWIEAMLFPFGTEVRNLHELDEYLEFRHKKVIFLVDGLEDLCMDAQLSKSENWKYVIRAICQDVMNELDNLDYGNIGILIFARKDMLSEAIETNYEQFRNIYIKYELNWSQTEALRLALWLSARAYPALSDGIDILSASKNVLAEKLTRLWGLKLGKPDSKEAISDRWIIAALSDFTGQLQARDIVRFLKYATSSYAELNMIYSDRLIMPNDIRNAITPCSKDKLDEIKSEMKHIYEILEKFINMNVDKKTLPMTLDMIDLTGEQISRLETQGLLKISDKKYYLPEIIRLALGFKYQKGARPKVLSLLVK